MQDQMNHKLSAELVKSIRGGDLLMESLQKSSVTGIWPGIILL